MGEPQDSAAPPNWGPQQPWAPGPTRGRPPKWLLGMMALVAVVAVIVGATVFFSRNSSNGSASTTASDPLRSSPSPAAADSDVASANDAGPVGIITDEPTCPAWKAIYDTLAAAEQSGWAQRDPSIPASAWTPPQRAMYEATAAAMRTAADQAMPLAKQTPHRAVRELYEQTVAYLRAYADSMPTYEPVDDHLGLVTVSTGLALSSICESITNGAASARVGLIPAAAEPTASSPITPEPAEFLQAPDPSCAQWHSLVAKYTGEFAAWRATDPNVSVTQWGPAQRRINDGVAPVMRSFADDAEAIALSSPNGVLQDLATLAAQYRRAYAAALPTYIPADAALTRAASAATGAIDEACLAAEG